MPGVYNRTTSQKALTSVLRGAGTVNGDTVDRGDTNVSVLFVVLTGTLTDGTHTISVDHSDDGSSFTAATTSGGQQGADIATVATNDDTVFEIGYNGPKRYCRLKCVTTGATGGILGAVAVKADGRKPGMR